MIEFNVKHNSKYEAVIISCDVHTKWV